MAERGIKKFTARWIETVQVEDPDRFHRSRREGLGPSRHTERFKVLGLHLSPQERWPEAPGHTSASSRPFRSIRRAPRPAVIERRWQREPTRPPRRRLHKKVETVDQLLDRYLTDYAPAESKWTAEVRRIFKKDVRPAIGGHKITAVTKADILAILNAVKDRGAGVTSNRTLAAVRKAFNWAVSEGYLKASPVQGISQRVKEQSRSRSLSEAEDPGILERSGQGQDGAGNQARASARTGYRPADWRGLWRHEV